MDPFAGFNPWLVLAAAVFIGFVLGRVSIPDRPSRPKFVPVRPRVRYVPAVDLDKEGEAEVREILETEGKIAAIRRFRELTGEGLREAKDAVEALIKS